MMLDPFSVNKLPSNLPSLRPYQVEGAAFLSERKHAGLFDDCGLGKTPQSLTAARDVGARLILVVCPAVARFNWAREAKRWYDPNADVILVKSKIKEQIPVPDTGALVLSISHDLLTDNTTLAHLLDVEWDLLIVDEAHFMKSKGAKRTKAVYGTRCDLKGKSLAAKADRTWILTGTPAPNHAGELWTHLRALYPEAIPGVAGKPMGEAEYVGNYCRVEITNWGVNVVGSKNMRELRRLIAPFFIRRLKKDVLKDLPEVTLDVLPVSLKDVEGEQMNRALAVHPDAQHLAEAVKTMGETDLLDFMKSQATELATYRRHTGLLKLPVCLEWLKTEMVSTDKKYIVFAIHHEVIDKLMEHMATFNPVKIDGRDTAQDRDHAEQTFMNDPSRRLFVGQIAAAGTALTLTVSSDVAFFETDWVPSNNYQALSRAHRFTQTRGVVARFLTLPHSIDDIIQRAIVRKTRELTELFG